MNARNAKSLAHDLSERSMVALHEVKDKVAEGGRQAVSRVDRKAHEKPWAFVGIAALFTALLGFFLGRGRKRE